MKINNLVFLVLIAFAFSAFFLQGCGCDTVQYEGFYYEPVYVSPESVEAMVEVQEPREIIQPGGIYYKAGFVFILEKGVGEYWEYDNVDGSETFHSNIEKTGIHIIDDRDYTNPVNVAFIQIPGVNGMAAKNNQLYVDSYTDLLVFDITEETQPKLSERIKNVYTNYNYYYDQQFGMISGYNITTQIYEYEECSGFLNGGYDDYALESGSPAFVDNGVAGSMARFVTVGDYLYNIDYSDLHLFDISTESPQKISDIHIGWEIETIYPHEDKLFFGASDGMFIYDNSNPANPLFLSKYEHIRSCDPVVVKGDYAYVTLRSGSECQGFTNQLDIVDISDPVNPLLAKTYQMNNPHGLSIYDNCLYICDGEFGFRSFTVDATDPTLISENAETIDIHSFDVITLPSHMMIIGNDGFYQYSRNCGSNFDYLSTISFGN